MVLLGQKRAPKAVKYMKKLIFIFVALSTFAGCKLDPNPDFYEKPKIENISVSPELGSITKDDNITVSAKITNTYGMGYVCVKYWVCTPTWGADEEPILDINAKNELCQWIEPQSEDTKGEWKKLASLKHTSLYTCKGEGCDYEASLKPSTCPDCSGSDFASVNVSCPANKPIEFVTQIPKQSKGKFVLFHVYCVNDYGLFNQSENFLYTVQ